MKLPAILMIIGGICLIAGVLYLNRATAGVGGIAAACFFGILARIAQAEIHRRSK